MASQMNGSHSSKKKRSKDGCHIYLRNGAWDWYGFDHDGSANEFCCMMDSQPTVQRIG